MNVDSSVRQMVGFDTTRTVRAQSPGKYCCKVETLKELAEGQNESENESD